MKPERRQQIEEIFQAALEREPNQRAAFLDEACAGDSELREEVESLLAADKQAGGFIEPPERKDVTENISEQARSIIGQTINHYRVLALLGAGGMGEVYLAQDTSLSRKVALKLLLTSVVGNINSVQRFQQEARAASALNHPNIITVYEIGQADDLHYIATEFVEGDTLRGILAHGEIALSKLLEILAQVADGLAKAHAAGIVHRDLKPENIMVTPDGFAKILDFGLAKLLETQKSSGGDAKEAITVRIGKTQPGVVMGTAGYMSPEQAQGKPVDHQSDIFSFGCILYEAMTGHQPFEAETAIDVLHKVIHETASPVSEVNPNCPAELQRIIRKCMAKDKNRRCQSIKDVAIDLRDLAEEYEVHASSSGAKTFTQSSIAARTTDKKLMPRMTDVEATLSDDAPKVIKMTRFAWTGIILAVLAVLSAIAIVSLHRRVAVDAELKLESTSAIALDKARGVLRTLGYDPTDMDENLVFTTTDFDLNYVSENEGFSQAQHAVGEGKAAVWKVAFAPSTLSFGRPSDEPGEHGEFIVWLDHRGRLVRFATPPSENAESVALEKEQAIKMTQEIVGRMFSLDLSGYQLEFNKKSFPPGVTEVTWRNPNPVFGHRETVQVEFQSSKVTKLSRLLERPPKPKTKSGKEIVLSYFPFIIGTLWFSFSVVAFVFGFVFLLRSNRWSAIRHKLPIASNLIIALGVGAYLAFSLSTIFSGIILPILLGCLVAFLVGASTFIPLAGLFVWLRNLNPARLYGAEQLVNGRFLSKPVAASLVYGTLGGVLTLGIYYCGWLLQTMIPGYISDMFIGGVTAIGHLGIGIVFLVGLATAVFLAFLTAAVVELTERFVHKNILATLLPALIFAFLSVSFRQTSLRILALEFLYYLLLGIVQIYIYRTRGLAAFFFMSISSQFLFLSLGARSLGEPGFVLQANALVLFVFLLLAIGVWGYVREYVQKNLPDFGID